jgi:dTDP-4-dehydrorhamnose 3,5-epimerase
LERIPTGGGDVMHALKKSDIGFNGFGEVYFSWVEKGYVKAWKCHKRMTLNLVVPIGKVNFVFHSTKEEKSFRSENIGDERYVRLTVPPGIWFGFQGKASGSSLIMNVADIEYGPEEVLHKSESEIDYNWSFE